MREVDPQDTGKGRHFGCSTWRAVAKPRLFSKGSANRNSTAQLHLGVGCWQLSYLKVRRMLRSMRVENFKAWHDTGEIRLAPLTIFFGVNSAGKSSLGHLLLGLKQTVDSSDRRRTFHLGDDNSLIDLGTFEDCVYGHDVSQKIKFSLAWDLPTKLLVKNPLEKRKIEGEQLKISVEFGALKESGQIYVHSLNYTLSGENEGLTASYSRDENKHLWETDSGYRLVKSTGRQWPLEAPDKFYRISDQSRARFQNADFLTDFALATEEAFSQIYYLGPLRKSPKRVYQWSGDAPSHVGMEGENSIPAILSASQSGIMINRGPKYAKRRFDELIAWWLKEMGVIDSFSVRPLSEGRKEYEVLVKTHRDSSEVKITDVGFGVSQVLPALVQAYYCPPNSTVWMEQPEIHLHPQVQAELADALISATKATQNGKARNTQLVIESHSEHLLQRIQRRVAEGELKSEDVAIYFCKRSNTGAELEELKIDEYGEINNWPDNFFGNEMADLMARTVAGAERKAKSSKN
jgi:predicted ATPase